MNIAEFEPIFAQLSDEKRLIDLYADESDKLWGYGPILCQPTEKVANLIIELIKRFHGHFVSYLKDVSLSLIECAQKWKETCNIIHCTTGEKYYLRYADTRVFCVLAEVMNQTQWDALTGAVSEWGIFDRSGKAQLLVPKSIQPKIEGKNLHWTEEQYCLLLEKTWPDALLAEAYALDQKIAKAEDKSMHHKIANSAYQEAIKKGWNEDFTKQVQLCLYRLLQAKEAT